MRRERSRFRACSCTCADTIRGVSLALFDFDGTITSSDTWTPFMRFATPPARLVAGQILLAPVFVGYRTGLMSAAAARTYAARVAFRGLESSMLRRRGLEYATTHLPRTVRPAAIDRIEWHRSQGHAVVVVSAALDVYLQPWCDRLGLDCICTTLEERGGRLTGRLIAGDCSGAEKARRIRERYPVETGAHVYAYGDTIDDREMLALAHTKFYRWREVAADDVVA